MDKKRMEEGSWRIAMKCLMNQKTVFAKSTAAVDRMPALTRPSPPRRGLRLSRPIKSMRLDSRGGPKYPKVWLLNPLPADEAASFLPAPRPKMQPTSRAAAF